MFEYSSDEKLLKRSDGLEFIYDTQGLAGVVDNSGSTAKTYFYRKDAQGNIVALLDENGAVVVKYVYNAWGEHKVLNPDGTENTSASFIGNINPFRYRGYYYDTSLKLYYLVTRYYDPVVGRFISQDSFDYADPDTINGLNLYAYCNNNPVMNVDPTGHAWWSWLISGLQIAVGAALVFTGLGAGFGASLIVGGTLGIITNIVGSTIGNGLSSMLNGYGAISTGISLLSFGPVGIIAGIGLMLVGGATMAFGANEVVSGITGTNYIRDFMGGDLYDGLYVGLNVASSIGTIAARLGMRAAGTRVGDRTRKATPYAKRVNADGRLKAYYDGKGNLSWSQHVHNTKVGKNVLHWHTELPHSEEIYNFIEFIFRLILRR